MSTPSRSRRCAPPTNASCKTYRKRSTPSTIELTELPSEREIKEMVATTKADVTETMAAGATAAATTTPAANTITKKTTTTAETEIEYTQQAWSTIPRGSIRRDNDSKKSGTWMTKS